LIRRKNLATNSKETSMEWIQNSSGWKRETPLEQWPTKQIPGKHETTRDKRERTQIVCLVSVWCVNGTERNGTREEHTTFIGYNERGGARV
jgi:hypothetical protein